MEQKLSSFSVAQNDERKENNKVGIEISDEVDYDTALNAAGYGKFSQNALGACVIAFFAGGMENCIMSYVLPAARCDLELSPYQTGLVNMSFTIGGIISAFFWAIIGDVFGRRNSLAFTLILDAVLTFAQSFSPNFVILLAIRGFNGFLIGAVSALTLAYASDLIGPKKRSLYVSIIGTSYVTPWFVMPALAWLEIPFKLEEYESVLPIHSWRLYLVLGSLPPLIGGLWISLMPESPRFLLNTDRPDDAIAVLNKIYKMNYGNHGDYKIKKLLHNNSLEARTFSPGQSRAGFLLKNVLLDLKLFVSKSYIVKSSLIAFIFLANMSAGFGLNIWIPELILRAQHGVDCDPSINESRSINATNMVWNTHAIFTHNLEGPYNFLDVECNDSMDQEVFTSGMIVGTCCILANAICSLFSVRSGPKGLRATSAGIAGITAVACAGIAASVCSCFGSSSLAVVSAAALNSASLVGNVLLMTLLLHAVPAKLSSLAVCWGCWWGRVGGMASNYAVGALLDLSCPAPFIGVGAVLALSIGAIFFVKFDNEEREEIEDYPDVNKSKGID